MICPKPHSIYLRGIVIRKDLLPDDVREAGPRGQQKWEEAHKVVKISVPGPSLYP